MKSKDLYWGSSSKTKLEKITDGLIDPKSFIQLFPNLQDESILSRMKFSYHESGQMHIKNDRDEKDFVISKSSWIKCDSIKSPKLFFFIITKKISLYKDFNKFLNNKGVSNIILKVPQILNSRRLLVEFYISPKGHQFLPDFTLNISGTFSKPKPIIVRLNDDFNLMIQLIAINGEGVDVMPDASELFFIAQDLK